MTGSTDLQFIERVRDIVGLCLYLPDMALVLCVDEKSQIQALHRTAPCLTILPTTPREGSRDAAPHFSSDGAASDSSVADTSFRR